MLSRRVVVAFLLGLGACASNTAQRSPASPRNPGLEFSLSLQAQLKGETEIFPLDPEGVLHSGDQIVAAGLKAPHSAGKRGGLR